MGRARLRLLGSVTMTRPATPLPWLLLLLSVTTGLVDAISVLGLGQVFTANLTGNIVFLGFAAVGTPGFAPLSYVVAILAFMTGALVAGRVGKGHEGRPMRRWLLVAALLPGRSSFAWNRMLKNQTGTPSSLKRSKN